MGGDVNFFDLDFGGESKTCTVEVESSDNSMRRAGAWSCPECGKSMTLKQVDPTDKKCKRKAWFCRDCGMQTCDEWGRR